MAYLKAYPLFEAAERAMQVRVYRDHGKLYEAWSIDASIPLAAGSVDHEALSAEIASRLQHEEGCKVEAIDLPAENGESQDVLVAVTFFGGVCQPKDRAARQVHRDTLFPAAGRNAARLFAGAQAD